MKDGNGLWYYYAFAQVPAEAITRVDLNLEMFTTSKGTSLFFNNRKANKFAFKPLQICNEEELRLVADNKLYYRKFGI